MGIVINSARLEREVALRGWTHADLAKAAGLSSATIAAASSGKRVSPKTLRLIAIALASAPQIDGVDGLLF
jgi:transcriptional regulator with XRE-family HTH domain